MKYIITISFILFSLQCFSQDSCKSILNKKPILDTLSVSFGERDMYEFFAKKVFDTLSISCNNQDAIQIFEHRIKKLKLVVECKGDESLTEISNIILNFTLLTDIESESDGNYIGQYNPTTRDIERWEKWFCIHRKNICWYQKYNVLYLKE